MTWTDPSDITVLLLLGCVAVFLVKPVLKDFRWGKGHRGALPVSSRDYLVNWCVAIVLGLAAIAVAHWGLSSLSDGEELMKDFVGSA